jgi:hypothetical protein
VHDDPSRPAPTEGVLVFNVSGTIGDGELPDATAGLPRFTISTAGQTPDRDVIATPETLDAFAGTCRTLLSKIEAYHKQLVRLHVFAAIPMSAAVVLGTLLEPSLHPTLSLHDRTGPGGGYVHALDVGALETGDRDASARDASARDASARDAGDREVRA